jgi:hypothetical protein
VHFPLDDAGTVHYNYTTTWDLLSPTALSAQAFAADCAAKFGLSAAAATTALERSVAAQISAHLQREPDTVANRSVVVKGAFKHPVAARKMTRHSGSRSAKQRYALTAAAGDTTAATGAADTDGVDCVDAATEAVTSGTKAASSKKRASSSAASSSAKRSRSSGAASCAAASIKGSSSGSTTAAKPKKLQHKQQQQQQQQRTSTSSGSDSDSSIDDDWLDDNLPCCMLCTDSELHECECSQCPRSFHIDCINSFTNGGAGPTTATTTATGCSRESREWVCKWCEHGKGGALQPPLFKVTWYC